MILNCVYEEATIFLFKQGVEEIITLQPKDGFAKLYQVKQVRELLIKYNFIHFDDE